MRGENDKTKQSLADAYMDACPAIFFCWGAEAGWPVDYVSDNVDLLGRWREFWVMLRKLCWGKPLLISCRPGKPE